MTAVASKSSAFEWLLHWCTVWSQFQPYNESSAKVHHDAKSQIPLGHDVGLYSEMQSKQIFEQQRKEHPDLFLPAAQRRRRRQIGSEDNQGPKSGRGHAASGRWSRRGRGARGRAGTRSASDSTDSSSSTSSTSKSTSSASSSSSTSSACNSAPASGGVAE